MMMLERPRGILSCMAMDRHDLFRLDEKKYQGVKVEVGL